MTLLSRSQSFDYVRLEGLQKLTNVTAHDWDLYILKELVDNGLDADEAFSAPDAQPQIDVEMQYAGHRLEVMVRNRALFPMDDVSAIFDLERHVSAKDFYNRPTRGAQGNALKTLLGIPYALQYHYFSTYAPRMTPLSIASGDTEIELQLTVDEFEQKVTLTKPVLHKLDRPVIGTEVHVSIYRFIQERPRTSDALLAMAGSFKAWNPHVNFDFSFFVNDKPFAYASSPSTPANKRTLQGPTPVTWYSYSEFRELLHALLRASREHQLPTLTLGAVAAEFGLKSVPSLPDLGSETPLEALLDGTGLRDNDTSRLFAAWQTATDHSLQMPLQPVGSSAFRAFMDQDQVASDSSPSFIYRSFASPSDRGAPFTLEVGIASNGEGKRRIITGINRTPTYHDPFMNKPLTPPESDDICNGLDKLLDYYELPETLGITLMLHLTAPAVVYENYGKSAINDEPYRTHMVDLMHKVIEEYKEATRPAPAVDHLTPMVRKYLPNVVKALGGLPLSEKQLLSAIKRTLLALKNDTISLALEQEQADDLIREVVAECQTEGMVPGLIHASQGRLALPHHPDDIVYIRLLSQSLRDTLEEASVRAIIIASRPELEELIGALEIPLRYDTALLLSDGDLNGSIATLAHAMRLAAGGMPEQILPSIVPLWVVRDATPSGAVFPHKVREALAMEAISPDLLIDMGLQPGDPAMPSAWITPLDVVSSDIREALRHSMVGKKELAFYLERQQSAYLDTLPSRVFLDWWEEALRRNGIPLKLVPDKSTLARLSAPKVQEALSQEVQRLAVSQLRLDPVLEYVTQEWQREMNDWAEQVYVNVEERLKVTPRQSWHNEADLVLRTLLQRFMSEQRVETLLTMIGMSQ